MAIVGSNPGRPGCRRGRSGAFGLFRCALGVIGCFRFVPLRSGGRPVRWCAFGPFPCVLRDVGLVLVRSVNYRAHWGSSGSFVCVRYVSVLPGGRRFRLG